MGALRARLPFLLFGLLAARPAYFVTGGTAPPKPPSRRCSPATVARCVVPEPGPHARLGLAPAGAYRIRYARRPS